MDFTFTPDWEADLPLYEQIYRYAVAGWRKETSCPPAAGWRNTWE